MKKNRLYKKLLAAALAVSCTVGMAACGGKKEEGDRGFPDSGSNPKDSDWVYTAQSQSVGISGIGAVEVSGDEVYFIAGEWDKETKDDRQAVGRIKFGETVPDRLPIVLEANSFSNVLQTDADGNLLFILGRMGGEGEEGTYDYFLSRYGTDGTELMSRDISGFGGDADSFYIQHMAQDGQGNIYLADSEGNIWILDREGTKQGKVAGDDRINGMITLPNGNVAVAYSGDDGNVALSEINPKTQKHGKTYGNLPEGCNRFAPGRENTILAMGNDKVYEYNISEETSSELFSWIDCDIDGNNISGISMQEDGGILAVLTDWSGGEQQTELVYLAKQPVLETVRKETVILGTTYLNEDVKQQVLTFNQNNDKYHVEIKEYGNGDRAAGETLMDAEIAAGGGPDLLDLTYASAALDKYLSKGVLEDLNPYMDGDGEIRREDYIEEVLNAYQRNGRLYCIVPGFMISTVIGKTSDVGTQQGWTIDDVIALMDSRPDGTDLFTDCTKREVLRFCCTTSLDSFIDWERGECRFDDGYFEKVLEFANRFPKEAVKGGGDESVPAKIQSGKQVLREESIHGVASYQMHCQLFGGPVTCIGYPTVEGSGTYIMPNRIFGINVKSKAKDGAWEFLKTFLSEDYQKEQVRMVFPILRSVFDGELEKAMTPEYREEDGERTEVPKTSYRYAEWETDIYAATKEQAQVIRDLIETADGVYSYHQEIAAIIEEEAAPFFDGQKSAKEAAGIIQSRVRIYVNENMQSP